MSRQASTHWISRVVPALAGKLPRGVPVCPVQLRETASDAWVGYGLALLTIALVLAMSLKWPMPADSIRLIFLGAIVLVSWIQGLGPGLLSAVLGALFMSRYFVPYSPDSTAANLSHIISWSSFVLASLLVGSLHLGRDVLLRAHRRRLQYLHRLHRLETDLGRADRTDEVYRQAEVALREVLEAKDVSVLLPEPGAASVGGKLSEGANLERKEERPVLVPDVECEPVLASFQARIRAENIRALAVFPISSRERPFGRFFIVWDRPHQCSADEIETAQSIVSHVGFSLERRRAEVRMAAQNAISEILSGPATLAETAPQILDVVCRSFGWSVAALWRVDPESDLLRCVAVHNTEEAGARRFERFRPVRTYGLGQGLPGRVWAARKPVWVESLGGEEAPENLALLRSALAFPITASGEVLAVMEFYGTRSRRPDHEILRLCSNLGSTIGQFEARNRATAALSTERALLEAVLRQLPEGVLVAEPRGGRVILRNEQAGALLNTARKGPEEVPAPAQLMRSGNGERGLCEREEWPLARVLSTWEPVAPQEIEFGSPEGLRTVRVSAAPVLDGEGRLAAAVATLSDVTEQKRAAAAYATLYREAEAANRVKDEFLSTLSHELRTPLNALLGWSRLLITRPLTPEMTTKALRTIERNAKAQAQIVDDLLDVSSIITGRLQLEVIPVELASVIREAMHSVQAAAHAKSIRIECKLDPAMGTVEGDPKRLQQAVWNLLSNAVKFTGEHGRVEIGLTSDTSYARISVSDNGRGISPSVLPYVFERFRQADSSTTRRYGGLGLGLAIVRHLIELHGGTVQAESAGEGQGARFTISLPLLPPAPLG